MKDWTERAAEAAREIITEFFNNDKWVVPAARGNGVDEAHVHWMCEELAKADMTPTKACRWLGYVQAWLIINNKSDLDREKARNQRTGDRPYLPRGHYSLVEDKARSLGRKAYSVLSNGGIVEATVYGSSAKATALTKLYNGEATLTTDEPDFYAKTTEDGGWESCDKNTWGARPVWLGIGK